MTTASPLLADQLAADPKLAQARKLIHETIDEKRAKLTGIKPADNPNTATSSETARATRVPTQKVA
ncbi:MAG: hypothetical protein AAF328_09710, partial [Planctomycetota bacterium]